MSKNLNKKILIAEDDYAIALALETILRNNIDCELTVTRNGQEAWDALLKQNYDLILCDWNMPVKTGHELLNEVKIYEKTKHIPFIMLTARADKVSVIEAVKTGVTDYIHKPFDRAGLIKKIKENLAQIDCQPAANEDTASPAKEVVDRPRKIITQIADRLRDTNFNLPMPSHLASTVKSMLENNEAPINDIAAVVKTDPNITVRLIALSNSAVYRGATDNHTLEEAITRLGLPETLNYLWVFTNTQLFETDSARFAQFLGNFRDHSVATAQAAKYIAQQLNFPNADQIYYMGLLHDIGAILVMQILEDLAKHEDLSDTSLIFQAIRELHAKFGCVLLERWNLPKSMQSIVLYHDNIEAADTISDDLYAINFSNLFVEQLGYKTGCNPDKEIDLLELDSAKHLGIDANFLEKLTNKVHQHVKLVTTM